MSQAESLATAPADAPKISFGGRAVAFAVTWTAYFSYYFGRKGVAVVKSSIASDLGANALYGVETGLLGAYALGQYLSGLLGDRIGARRLLSLGLVVSAAACIAFGSSSVGLMFLALYVVNGLAQSTGWPGATKAMAEWTTPHDRGRVMGLWGTCYQAGGVAATAFCARLARAYGWRAAFFGPALVMIAVAILVSLTLKRGPMAGAKTPGRPGAELEDEETRIMRRAEQRRVMRSPLIYSYGAAYFSIKLVRYSLLFWLTWYLEKALGYEKVRAADISTAFEIGGFFGTLFLGFLSDRFSFLPRSAFAMGLLVLLAGAFVLYSRFGSSGTLANVLLLALVGFLLFGPDALISGAAAQDAGGRHAAGFAAGMVNGMGSIGAILQESVTRGVSERYGWSALFSVFIGLSLLSALCLVPALGRKADAT